MTNTDPTAPSYDELLARARELYPGVRIGRPGRSRGYWAMITALRALRTRFAVDIEGVERIAPGPAVIVGNHAHALDPVMVVMMSWWRVSAFTKLEWFEHRLAPFFRVMGQIPLRRGDEASTAWAMQMSQVVLADGAKIGIYPEGTRSPDPSVLHRLHKRILIPMLQANPDVPVHVAYTQFGPPRGLRRRQVTVRLSQRLPVDARTMDAEELTAAIRDALLELGGLRYVDRYARDVKAELRAAGDSSGQTPAHSADTP